MLKSVVQTTFRCPYPDCTHQGDAFESMSDGVYLCPGCERLSVACGAAGCTALNRPMSHFCRICGRDLFSRTKGPEIAQRWRDAAQFDYPWRLAPEGLGPPALVAELNHAPGYRPPHVLLEWTLLDGVLAIHQGGGFLAVTHPFAEAEEDASSPGLLWSQAEENYLTLPDIAYEADDFRPFPPTPTPDHRYLLFSTPYAVFALDLCSLPGWTVSSRSHDFRLLFQCLDRPEVRLAAAPIPLSTNPPQVGLLLYDAAREKYLWTLLNVAAPENRTPAEVATVLPLEGAPCQHRIAAGQAIAFSTDRGHWVWRIEDALESDPKPMRRTWPGPHGGGTLVLDQHVERRGYLTWSRQHLEASRRTRDSREPSGAFEWCYQVIDDQTRRRRFQSYQVSLPGLEATFPTNPAKFAAAIPLGQRWLDSLAETWFLGAEEDGQLYRRGPGVKELSPTRILTVDSNEIDGLQLADPLLTIVSRDSAGAPQRISIYTLEDPRIPMTLEVLKLRADPLVWSNWLFTCETDGGELRIFRREIQIEESSLHG
jgi:hypothetical protein